MKKTESVDYYIKTAWHAIARMYNHQAVKEDITTSIGFVLLNIDTEFGTPATKIAPLMGLESRSLTRMLKSMEEKGLIERVPDEHDKRSVRIMLTHLGKEKKEVSKRVVKAFNYTVYDEVASEKLEVFIEVMQQILSIIEENNIYKETNSH
ncbi:MarR family winged helix-turn-helix transcriptional regulator [Marinigracilibium pacificum]|uniref:MarR family transcriptional regulator n=1 Tax=Marinigracilibium pacificum TaxID=2729599 RepID=A0A848IRT0_9BACT|nr:MarR family transcriptional regulator [Marinigracilibium pacificum]NMM47057.1 MarR family transcriptional regulator [Marinigracilibium pacificum]